MRVEVRPPIGSGSGRPAGSSVRCRVILTVAQLGVAGSPSAPRSGRRCSARWKIVCSDGRRRSASMSSTWRRYDSLSVSARLARGQRLAVAGMGARDQQDLRMPVDQLRVVQRRREPAELLRQHATARSCAMIEPFRDVGVEAAETGTGIGASASSLAGPGPATRPSSAAGGASAAAAAARLAKDQGTSKTSDAAHRTDASSVRSCCAAGCNASSMRPIDCSLQSRVARPTTHGAPQLQAPEHDRRQRKRATAAAAPWQRVTAGAAPR